MNALTTFRHALMSAGLSVVKTICVFEHVRERVQERVRERMRERVRALCFCDCFTADVGKGRCPLPKS